MREIKKALSNYAEETVDIFVNDNMFHYSEYDIIVV